ncbi:hypothetical protein CPter91_3021 [Collimonas pratensis]|uniref:Uncharacterized protein n=1 Tax=Collimonas pratensis TaxID=279113 RepID=A0A127Q6T7_9BURK|nr:hypothetical protein CPter91_3021 [Collimonas pratensis]
MLHATCRRAVRIRHLPCSLTQFYFYQQQNNADEFFRSSYF